MDDYLIGVLSNIGVISFLALSAYLLLLTGEISFGQQAFFAIGAYAAGIATALWGWPLGAALVGGARGRAAAVLVGVPTLRLHGLYFAIATLAFAEMVRILFELFRYQVVIDGELVGPNGADGFRGIRYIFENDIGPVQFLAADLRPARRGAGGFMLLERSRLGVTFRMIGEDAGRSPSCNGIAVSRAKVLAAGLAGALAGIGGGLYAHLTTYVEPRIFDVMLGVHSLAYGLIGGLGTALGPAARRADRGLATPEFADAAERRGDSPAVRFFLNARWPFRPCRTRSGGPVARHGGRVVPAGGRCPALRLHDQARRRPQARRRSPGGGEAAVGADMPSDADGPQRPAGEGDARGRARRLRGPARARDAWRLGPAHRCIRAAARPRVVAPIRRQGGASVPEEAGARCRTGAIRRRRWPHASGFTAKL